MQRDLTSYIDQTLKESIDQNTRRPRLAADWVFRQVFSSLYRNKIELVDENLNQKIKHEKRRKQFWFRKV